MNNFPDYLPLSEATIIDGVITAALNRNLTISVNDGVEWCLKKSTDRAKIQQAVAATDDTTFSFRDADDKYVGFMWFIHGNRADVISDYSDDEMLEAIWNEVEPLCDWDLYK